MESSGRHRSGLLTAGGVLSIVAGVLEVIGGVIVAFFYGGFRILIIRNPSFAIDLRPGIIPVMSFWLIVVVVPIIALGIVAIVAFFYGGFRLIIRYPGYADDLRPGIIPVMSFPLIIVVVPIIALGIVAIVGGISTIRRKNYSLSLAGAICALPSIILGILAIIFVAVGEREFGASEVY
jgi:hypothetical protein